MSEVKHTPGPWIIQYGSLSNHCCFEYSVCGEGIEDDIVAEILGGDDRSEANADLIAAAPDLLELLSMALESLEAVWEQEGFYTCGRDLQRMRSAIAKARGES